MKIIPYFCRLLSIPVAVLLLSSAPLNVSAAPTAQKNTTQKTTAKKTTAKKTTAKKTTAKKTTAKKTTAKKTTKKNTRSVRRTTVIGKKPSTIQAAEYATDDAALAQKKADDLLMSAMGLLGVSYRFGGSNPASGLDCSGFIQYIFREAMNVNLPRTSAAMSEVGVAVDKADLKPGDLVFFRRGKARIGHVGMYIGDGKFIHAPRTGKSIEIQDLNRTYYVKNYAGARRVANNAARAARFIQ